MVRYWTVYWTIETADQEIGTFFDHTGLSIHDDVKVGDTLYAVTNALGTLFLLGKMVVSEIVDKKRASEILEYEPYEQSESAKLHAIALKGSGSRISEDYPLDSEMTAELLFIRKDGIRSPKFSSPGILDKQTLRGVSELTTESAKLFDEILESEIREQDIPKIEQDAEFAVVDEGLEQEATTAMEGLPTTFLGKRYERNKSLRTKAIKYHGVVCFTCDFSFGEMYGEHGAGFIEVHHKIPLAQCNGETEVDFIEDLVPLCANCHRMIHRDPLNPLSVDRLREIVNEFYEKLDTEE
jgi:predicted HNH restriction endonuclease